MTKFSFKGVTTALVTPFKRGVLDIESFKKLITHQLDNGVQGLVVGGTTGESPTLDIEELEELVGVTRAEVAGQVPVIVGTGSNSTEATIAKTRMAKQWQADAALVVVPYYNKPPQRGLVEHFKAVQNSCELPLILYNVPSRTGASLSVESVMELAKEPRIIGIKEATGDMTLAEQLIAATPAEFLLLSGDDGTCVQMALNGGDGVISVISHLIPQELRRLMDQATAGNEQAVKDFQVYMNLNDLIFTEPNPIPVKMALYQMNILESPELRLPLVPASEELSHKIKAELKKLELI